MSAILPVAILVAAAASATSASGQAAAPGKAGKGETIFKAQCTQCHNKAAGDTTPFGPPNLHGLLASKTITPQQATETIRNGKGVMPPFADKLSPADISSVVAYLKTM